MSQNTASIYASLLQGHLQGGEALHASQQMLEMVMDSIPQAVVWKDRSSVILGCNRVFADLAGMNPTEMIGKTDLEMAWASHEAQNYRHWDNLVMSSGTPQYNILEKIHRKDGQVRWLETNKIPIRDFQGEVVGILGTIEDVTERLAAESQMLDNLAEKDEQVRERTEELTAAQNVIRAEAIARAEVQQQEREQRAYAEALRDTAAAITRSLDMDDVMEQVLVGLQRVMRHNLGALFLCGVNGCGATGEPSLAHVRKASEDALRWQESDVERLPSLFHPLVEDDPIVLDGKSGPEATDELSALSAGRSVIVAPVGLAGRRIGYLVAASSSAGAFSASHIERIRVLADQAAIAISNAEHFAASARLAVLEERQRLARDLHDAVSQTLWTSGLIAETLASDASLEANAARNAQRLHKLTRGALAEMRSLLLELRPDVVEEQSLAVLVTQLVQAFETRRSVTLTCSIESPDELDGEVKLAVYRIIQEALNNIARHAEARNVAISVSTTGTDISLLVQDNGKGFSDASDVPAGHFGLTIMKERAEQLGGTIQIDSSPLGTRVHGTVPITPRFPVAPRFHLEQRRAGMARVEEIR